MEAVCSIFNVFSYDAVSGRDSILPLSQDLLFHPLKNLLNSVKENITQRAKLSIIVYFREIDVLLKGCWIPFLDNFHPLFVRN